jgi:site-specific DNA-methyltransferase (adenine-specific)
MKLDIQYVPIGDLNPAPYNPRKKLKPGDKEYEKIKRSLEEFGLVEPLVVNKDKTVVGGNQRLAVLTALGVEMVPCSMVDVDKKKEALLNIALNKIQGEWDYVVLKDVMVQLDTGEFDISITGFDLKECKGLYDYLKPEKGKNETECPNCGYRW